MPLHESSEELYLPARPSRSYTEIVPGCPIIYSGLWSDDLLDAVVNGMVQLLKGPQLRLKDPYHRVLCNGTYFAQRFHHTPLPALRILISPIRISSSCSNPSFCTTSANTIEVP